MVRACNRITGLFCLYFSECLPFAKGKTCVCGHPRKTACLLVGVLPDFTLRSGTEFMNA